jgi:DNA-binding HxlR family transcriptional regulator
MKGYGQFCPLIIRELLSDDQSFNKLRKGVPLMSPSLLSSRLKSLEAAGIVDRHKTDQGVIYSLTEAGEELRPIVEALGVWGQRWARSDMSRDDLDPSLLMWDMHRRIDTSFFPSGRSVLRFEYYDYPVKMRLWWLVITDGDVDICLKDPGYDVDLFIRTRLKTMTQIWLGDTSVSKARRDKQLELSGNTALKNNMPKWIGRSLLAGIPPASPAM